MKLFAFVLLSAMLLTAAESAAQSIVQCGQHDRVLEVLETKYSEVPAAVGVAKDGRLVTVTHSEESLTWTVVVTDAYGRACIMADGDGMKILAPPPKGNPS